MNFAVVYYIHLTKFFYSNLNYSLYCVIYQCLKQLTQFFILVNGSCPDGWTHYNKHCYKHFSTRQRWSPAQFTCAGYGANLLSIHDDREQDFVIYYYQAKTKWTWTERIWTGLLKNYIGQMSPHKIIWNN